MEPGPSGTRVRRRLSAAERREALMRATVAVVAARGYDRASFSEIARTAGVSKGLLWHYFADGDELMVETARATLARLRDVVAAGVDLAAPVPDVVRAALLRAAGLVATHGDDLAALDAIVRNVRDPDGSQRLGWGEYAETHALQAELFRRGQREGSLRAADPHLMAVTYQGAVDTMIAYLRDHAEVDAGEHARAVADLLLHGMALDRP